MDDFLQYDNWFSAKYKANLDKRYPTYQAALNLLYQLPQHRIVETGCVRMKDDWGGGCSTVVFGEFVLRHGGHLITIDNDPMHMAICKELTWPYKERITYILQDSLKALGALTEPIDLLYLDSLDAPIDYENSPMFAQQHNLFEFLMAEKLLHEKSILMIDDAMVGMRDGSLSIAYGKPVRTNPRLLERGWRLILNIQQSLWVR